jgi:hypothetical protein
VPPLLLFPSEACFGIVVSSIMFKDVSPGIIKLYFFPNLPAVWLAVAVNSGMNFLVT